VSRKERRNGVSLRKRTRKMATRVDQLKDRIIDMIDGGLTRFGFTTGPDWHKLGNYIHDSLFHS
jgi:hypothetical protein